MDSRGIRPCCFLFLLCKDSLDSLFYICYNSLNVYINCRKETGRCRRGKRDICAARVAAREANVTAWHRGAGRPCENKQEARIH